MKRFLLLLTMMLLLSATAGYAQSTSVHDNPDTQVDEDQPAFIPNAFTPNFDGVNDEFYITNAHFTEFTFSVFDRWGNRVYSSSNPNFRWDGASDGEPVPSGIYVFVMDGTNPKGKQVKRSGTISIVR